MSQNSRQPRAPLPPPLRAALGLAAVLAAVIVWDQVFWWNLKPEYLFGWLVPFFVAFVVYDRWPRITAVAQADGASPLPNGGRRALDVLFGGIMGFGALCFLLGALYRAGAGVTQPGSFALAVGFAGLLLGLIYFNTPPGRVGAGPWRMGWRRLGGDARVAMVALFVFPALIWTISAPLVSAVENQLSLFLLRKIVAVVSFVFNTLGYPLLREGNTLLLPNDDRVGVEDACSGIRSLTACLFTGAFLAAVLVDRWWKKIALILAALLLAVFTNLLRSLFLTAWAYAHGSAAISGTFHDATGYAVLGLTFVGLLLLLPLFSGANWLRWLAPRGVEAERVAERKPE